MALNAEEFVNFFENQKEVKIFLEQFQKIQDIYIEFGKAKYKS